jgi:hypothetical protein
MLPSPAWTVNLLDSVQRPRHVPSTNLAHGRHAAAALLIVQPTSQCQ